MLFILTRWRELTVNLMSQFILVPATYTVCPDFRAFCITLVGFWASRLMIIDDLYLQ
jgi:hypothetical protein